MFYLQQFAVLAFAACVVASPQPFGYGSLGSPLSYQAVGPVYAQPIASLAKPAAAAAASAAASAPVAGYVRNVPSYSILGGNPGYGIGSLGGYGGLGGYGVY